MVLTIDTTARQQPPESKFFDLIYGLAGLPNQFGNLYFEKKLAEMVETIEPDKTSAQLVNYIRNLIQDSEGLSAGDLAEDVADQFMEEFPNWAVYFMETTNAMLEIGELDLQIERLSDYRSFLKRTEQSNTILMAMLDEFRYGDELLEKPQGFFEQLRRFILG